MKNFEGKDCEFKLASEGGRTEGGGGGGVMQMGGGQGSMPGTTPIFLSAPQQPGALKIIKLIFDPEFLQSFFF